MGGMADEDSMNAPGPGDMHEPEAQDNPQEESDETTSVFLPKSALPEGKKYKKGDKVELTVEDVDPETGEVQACIYPEESKNNSSSRMGYDEAFDRAMPPEES